MTALDMPREHTNVILEIPSSTGPFGAKALGETLANLHAPAIYNAIHDATGVWVRHVPATPEKLLKLSREHEGAASQEAGANDVLLSWLLALISMLQTTIAGLPKPSWLAEPERQYRTPGFRHRRRPVRCLSTTDSRGTPLSLRRRPSCALKNG